MMNNELRPYESYIDTGMDWLEAIPGHWEKTSLRGITELSNKRYGLRNDLELLSVYREYGVVRKNSRDDNHNVESLDLSNYKYVNKGYLVLNKMKMWQGSLGVSKYEGIVSPAYIVCKIKGNINFEYLHILLRSPKYKTIYNRISYGVRVGQWDMRYDDFKKINLFIPPRAEQDQIVKYLDHQLTKINKFIKAKKKLIAVLKEQKQAIINEAVTKGLDPNVKMKASGIEWLGDVPEHWEVRRLKTISIIKRGASPRPIDDPKYFDEKGKYAWVRISDVTNSARYLESTEQKLSELGASLSVKIGPGDLIVSICASVGKPCISNIHCCIHDGFVTLKKLNAHMVQYIFSIFSSKLPFIGLGNVGTQLNLNSSIIGNISIAIPPIEEIDRINRHVFAIENDFEKLISKAEKELELISEFKNSLISDVVTGKVDVRNIAIEELEEEIIEGTELDEDSTDDESLEAEDGDE